MNEIPHFTDPEWVDAMMALFVPCEPVPEPRVKPGQLWAACCSGRRCKVVWAIDGIVCVEYRDDDPSARKTHFEEDFVRLYEKC